jgi:hypothetical protein
VDVCEPPRHLLVMTKHVRQAEEQVVEATLTADGDHTILILEQRRMPVNLIAAYGAGNQVVIQLDPCPPRTSGAPALLTRPRSRRRRGTRCSRSRRSSGLGGADVLVEAEPVDGVVVRLNGG